jgi:3-oxoacyl-[acyl-carrier protein] reductase
VRILATYASDHSSAESLKADLGSSNDKLLVVQSNAGSVSAIEEVVGLAVKTFGRLDFVIANAGVLPMTDLASITEEVFDSTYNTNVKGVLFLCQVCESFPFFLFPIWSSCICCCWRFFEKEEEIL